MSIAQKIVQYRQEQNMTQAELAKRINSKQQRINEWEHEAYIPSIKNLEKIAKALGVTINDLISSQ